MVKEKSEIEKEIKLKLREIGNITLKEDISNLNRNKIGYLIKDIINIEKQKAIQSTKKEMLDKFESLFYRKIVTPKNIYRKDYNEPRISKNWFFAESKDFKFCPHCGKKLNNQEIKE